MVFCFWADPEGLNLLIEWRGEGVEMSKNQVRVLYVGVAWFVGLFIYECGSAPGSWGVLEEALGFTIGYSAFTALPVLLILFFSFGKKKGSAPAPTVTLPVMPSKEPTPKIGNPQEIGVAIYWYQKSLLLTDESQYLECFQCLERAVAADPSHVQSIYGIAHHYMLGLGVQEDLPIAAKWFRKAAELGFSPAQDKLGLMYEHGMGVA